jgi:hypothetical protein
MLTITQQLADTLAEEAINNGGATLTLNGETVTDGYIIGGGIIKDGDALAKIDAAESNRMIAARIYLTLLRNRKELQNLDGIGVWLNDGVIYLDAITIERNFIKAVTKGLSRQQQAIGGLVNGVYTEYNLDN